MTAAQPRVLFLIDSLAAGGAVRSLVDMAPRLAAKGVHLEVAVLVDRPGLAPELEAKGIRVHVVGGGSRASQFARLVRLLVRHRSDLRHTTLFESDILDRTAATFLRIPVVTTLADTPYGSEQAQESGIRPTRLRAARQVDSLTVRAVRRFHAVSEATAAACVERLRLDPDRVDVIPRGRDQDRLGRRNPQRTREVPPRLGLAPEASVVIAVGRQEPQKCFNVKIEAFSKCCGKCRRPSCIVGREARETERLLELSAELRIAGSVRFLGELNDVPDLMSAADVLVRCSYREGLPGVVLEAMALETPIVASDLPTVREAVPGPEFAYLVPRGDEKSLAAAILKGITDSEGSAENAASAREHFVDRFDIDAVCTEMADFYRRAMAS